MEYYVSFKSEKIDEFEIRFDACFYPIIAFKDSVSQTVIFKRQYSTKWDWSGF